MLRPRPLQVMLAVLAGVPLPFLGLIAWGSAFDSRGGEPFSTTVGLFMVLSPVWLLLGGIGAYVCFRSPIMRRTILAADFILVALIVFLFISVREENRRKQSGVSHSRQPTGHDFLIAK